jgi:hypothetical protein
VQSIRNASDKVYQLLAHGQWFSPGTPASSTTKTGRHDKAEILLKVALKHQISNQKSNLLSSHNHVLKNKSKFSLMRCYYLDLTKYRFNNCQETSRKKRRPGWLNELGSWITKQLIQAYH